MISDYHSVGFIRRVFLGQSESEVDDIIQNLRYIFSAKRGSSDYFPDFGLSEPYYRSTEEGIIQLSGEIRVLVARYEPRVYLKSITEDYDDEGRVQLRVALVLRSTEQLIEIPAQCIPSI